MARSFSGTAQYLDFAGAPLTAAPCTLACWFNQSSAATAAILSVNNTTSTANFSLRTNGTSHVLAFANGISATSSATFSLNAWNHAAGVFSSGTSQTVYLNGGNSGSGTSATPSGLNDATIGSLHTSSGHTQLFTGAVAEAAMWNVALTASEIAALALGRLPRHVRPSNLAGYWPLFGLLSPEPDESGNAQAMTVTGATAANHAPVTLFTRKSRTPPDIVTAGQIAAIIQGPKVFRPALSPAHFE